MNDFRITTNRLGVARKLKGLKQKELAILLDIPYWTITKWETGEKLISPNDLIKICEILGCSKEFLTDLTDMSISAADCRGNYNHSKTIIANGKEYKSLRKCAKALFVSYSALRNYLNGIVSDSILLGADVRFK